MKLSERAQQLIAQARIINFSSWEDSWSDRALEVFQNADDEGRYLTDGELAELQGLCSRELPYLDTVKRLRDRAPEIVEEARGRVLARYPNITGQGGDLYPPERAKSCWRDFWHFLRCITYGIAGHNPQYTSQEGLKNMELLYRELRVPLGAMVWGLENLKIASLKRVPESEKLAPYFDHLIDRLSQFT